VIDLWLFVTFAGVASISDDFERVEFIKFGDKEPSVETAVERIIDLENGRIFEELSKLISLIGDKKVKVDSEQVLRVLVDNFKDLDVELVSDGTELELARERLGNILLEVFENRVNYSEFVTRVGIELTRSKIMEEGEKRDQMIIKAVTIQEDLTKMFNILVSHVREWYGFYFHELGRLIDDHLLYLKLVYELGTVENFTRENLGRIIDNEKLIEKIVEVAQSTIPIKITQMDMERIKAICKLALDMENERKKIMEYLDELMKEAAPNIRSLIGPVIGAKLIRRAGGLEQLAKMPASTIQVLGAEKALFRALHGKGTPPKHGIIFQDPRVFKSPKWQRGKIARALAGKLAIAARVDHFSGEFIGDELVAELDKRIEEIKTKYPKPPVSKVRKQVSEKKKRKKARKMRKSKGKKGGR
jgi:nucleolar protein 56